VPARRASGPVGSGARFKLAINLPLLVYWQALGEALSLVRDLQIEPTRLMDILADTSGAPNMLKNRAATLAGALGGKEPSPVTVNVDTMKKDLSEMLERRSRLAVAGQRRRSRLRHASGGPRREGRSMLPVSWSSKPRSFGAFAPGQLFVFTDNLPTVAPGRPTPCRSSNRCRRARGRRPPAPPAWLMRSSWPMVS
jgi:hypothetical protein